MHKILQKLKMTAFIAVMAIIPAIAMASPLTPGEALSRLSSAKGPKKVSGRLDRMDVVHTLRTFNGNPSAYIFADRNAGGYLVVSADDCAAPLLGYSESGSFDSESLPPQFEYWLGEYSRQIEYASLAGLPAYAASSVYGGDDRKIVAPLMSTRWNQDAPYNLLVPSKDSRNYPTGCVATAMAQVMKYWNYPERGTGSGSITLPSGAQGESSMNFRIAFDWENMLDIYKSGDYDDTQAKAVATLMKACGYSTKMNYSMGGSGTLSRFAAQALVNNFSYNPDIEYCERDYYSAAEWEGILYAEMAAGRPVLYGGVSSSVGHEFVCDGYAGDGYFHFNWGWGGMSDGYFLLAALDPGSVGIGGGTGSDGFNYAQDIVIGIQPGASYSYTPRLTQLGSLSVSLAGKDVSMSLDYNGRTGIWANTDIRPLSVNFGVNIKNYDSSYAKSITIVSQTFAAPVLEQAASGGYMISYSGIGSPGKFSLPDDMPDGEYEVSLVTKASGNSDADWLPVLCSSSEKNSFYIKKNGTIYSVIESISNPIKVDNAEFISKLYYGNAAKLRVSLGNSSARDLSKRIRPVLYNADAAAMEGETITVVLPANGSLTEDVTTIFRILPGQTAPTRVMSYKLGFIDADTDERLDWSSSVRMLVGGGNAFQVSDFILENGILTGETVGSGNTSNVYSVSTEDNLSFAATIENKSVYFGYGISAQVFDQNNPSDILTTVTFAPLLILENINETGKIRGSLNTDTFDSYTLYGLKLYAMTPNGFAEIKNVDPIYFRKSSSSVDEIMSRNEMSVRYDAAKGVVIAEGDVECIGIYDINGNLISSDSVQNDGKTIVNLNVSGKGVVLAVARFKSGKVKAFKIIL